MIKFHTKKIKLTGVALALSAALVNNVNAQECKIVGMSNGSTSIYKGSTEGGAVCGWYDTKENVSDNHLTVTGSRDMSIYGGLLYNAQELHQDSAVNNNTVVVDGDIEGSAVSGGGGAGVGTINVTNNTVRVNGDVEGNIVGGHLNGNGRVSGNTVTINGNYSGLVFGAYFYGTGEANDNTITINGNIEGTAFGAYALGEANNNTVIIRGDVSGSIVGGLSSVSDTNGNSVTIEGNVIGIVAGGQSYEMANANNNTVTLLGNKKIGSDETEIYGGGNYYADGDYSDGDYFTGNTFNFAAGPLTSKNIANFEHYKFTLDPTLVNTDIALITSESIALGNSDKSIASKIEVVAIKPGERLYIDDKFYLIKSDGMTGVGEGVTTYGIGQQGISVLYDVKTEVDVAKGEATATILASKDTPEPEGPDKPVAGRVNPQLKALSEGHLADLMLLTRGADMVAYSTFDTIKEVNDGGFVPFVKMGGSHNRYDSGSHVKSNDYFIMTGVSLRSNNLTAAAFVEAGWGSYDTRNTFSDAAKVDGDGDNRYVGIGVLGKYDFSNGMYVDGSLRFGKSYNKFNTSDIKNLTTGETARYSFNRNYVSAHAGVGYIHNVDAKNEMDFSAKYLWAHLGSKDTIIAGDNIKFDSLESNRLRLTAIWNHQYTESTKFKAGVGYEYEFSAKAKATALNTYSINAPSVKGSTGILTLGMNINPESNKRLGIDFNINGYAGKRDGVSANIKVDYQF